MAEYIEREVAMDVREKLVELIGSTGYGNGSLVGNNFQKGFIEKIATHLIANGVTVRKWISVKDRLPEPEQEVIVCCKSQISNSKYVCCAFYVPENWLRESSQFSWDYECCDEYDEEQDDYVVKKGWYESIHNWDEYSVIGIDDAVTHWMPLQEPTKEDNNCKES